MKHNQHSEPTPDELVLQTTCDPDILIGLCEDHGLDHSRLVERRGLDGDAYTLAIALTATASIMRSVASIVKALIDAKHPVKLTTSAGVASGISKEDIPMLLAVLRVTGDQLDALGSAGQRDSADAP